MKKFIKFAAVALVAALAFAACDKKSAQEHLDAAKDTVKGAGDSIKEGAEKAGEAAGDALDAAKEKLGEAGDAVKEGAENAGEAAGDAVDAAKEKLGEAGDAVKEGAEELKEKVQGDGD